MARERTTIVDRRKKNVIERERIGIKKERG
jgi:hypothetical protein